MSVPTGRKTTSNSASESARLRILARLRAEHQDLLTLLASYGANHEISQRQELLEEIRIFTHLHYTVELGVFFCALKPLPAATRTVHHAAEGYSRAIELANQIAASTPESMDAVIHRLRHEILSHIQATESDHGAFALSNKIDVKWDEVERELSQRRVALRRTLTINAPHA